MSLEKLNTASAAINSETDSLIAKAKEPHGGTIMPIVDGLEKLLKNSK
jgi:hypothetical protein